MNDTDKLRLAKQIKNAPFEPQNTNIQEHIAKVSGNPHQVTKTEVGLGNVSNEAQLPLTGGTLTGDLTIDRSANTANLNISASAGQLRQLLYKTGTSIRFNVYVSSSAESGSEAGSNFVISRYNDSGVIIDNPFIIYRNTGNVTLGGAYNGPHLVMGSYHLWIDTSGRLRIKSSAPTSATDGTIVGTQS